VSELPGGQPERRSGLMSSAVLVAISAIIAGVGIRVVMVLKPPTPGTNFSDLLRNILRTITFLRATSWNLIRSNGRIRGPLLGVALGLLLGTLAIGFLRRRGPGLEREMPALAATMIVVLSLLCIPPVHNVFSYPVFQGSGAAIQRPVPAR